jgi:hypothetical protein
MTHVTLQAEFRVQKSYNANANAKRLYYTVADQLCRSTFDDAIVLPGIVRASNFGYNHSYG